jgi:predicted porin
LTAVRASNMIAYHSPDFGGIRVMLGSYMGENNTGAAAGKAGDGNGIHVRYAKGPLALGIASGTTKTSATTEVKTSTMGGSYNFGVAAVMFNSNTVSNTGAADIKGTLIGATVPMAGGTFKFSNATLTQGASETKRNAIGYVKPLSKRTSLYATYARNANSGDAQRGLNGATVNKGQSSTGYDLGVNHTF